MSNVSKNRQNFPEAGGFVLLGVLVPLLALVILSTSIALVVGHRWSETRQALDQSTMEENLDALLWTLRYYYHRAAVLAPVDDNAADTIITQSLTVLGYTGVGVGTWATLSSADNPAGIQVRVTPLTITNPSTPTRLVETGTFLDGRQVSQGSFSFRIEFQSEASAATLQQQRTLIFCQIPADSLALSGLQDLLNLSGNLASFTVRGTTFVRGQLDGSVPVDFSSEYALSAGSYGSQVTRDTQSLASQIQESDYRYQTEIANGRLDLTQDSSDLRTSVAQRTSALRSPIDSGLMFREGVAGDPSLSTLQAQLIRQNQPFYQVPEANRYWLNHNPSTGQISAASSAFAEANYSAGNLPSPGGWVVSTNVKLVAGLNQVVTVIDPALAPSPLFIGSLNQGNSGDYSDFIIELKAAPSLPQDFKLITPNTIVINGDLNTDQAHLLSLVGHQVYFGYSSFSQLTFTGSLASLSGSAPSPWRNADGVEHANAQVTLEDGQSVGSPVYYYLTLLQKQN